MVKTVNIQIRAKEWLRNLWDELYDRSKFHSRGELFESIVQFYKQAKESGVADDREQLQQQVTDFDALVTQLYEENTQKDQEIANLKAQLEESKEQDHSSELEEMRLELEAAREQLREAHSQNDHHISMRQMKEELWENDLRELKKENRNLEETLSQIMKECEMAEKKCKQETLRGNDFEKWYFNMMNLLQPAFDEMEGETVQHNGEHFKIETHEDLLEYLVGAIVIDDDNK